MKTVGGRLHRRHALSSAPPSTCMPGPGDGYRGEFMAWDPVARKKVWAIKEKFPVWSGTLVTAGDVAFYGTMDRWFKAVDAKTGEVLWQFRAPSGIIGQPVTYRGTDGKPVRRHPLRRRRLVGRGRDRPSSTRACATARSASSAPCRTCPPTRRAAARSWCSPCRSRRPGRSCIGAVARSVPALGAALSAARPAQRLGRAAGGIGPRTLRVCADPNNLPFSNAQRRRLREQAGRSWSPPSSARRSPTPGGRSGAASSATR